MRQIKDATNEIKKEINDSAEGTDLGEIKKEIDSVKDDIDDMSGPIKRQF
jgi:sec-independent protein translocase protein TatA